MLARRPADELALITRTAGGERAEWKFGQLLEESGSFAGALVERGVRRGDVVLTLLGNKIEYVRAMLACLRIGAAMLPCSEQLRARDIALRVDRARPTAIVCDERNLDELGTQHIPVLRIPGQYAGSAPDYAELEDTDPAFVLFTSGTSGPPKLVTHGQRYVHGQRLQAEHWMDARPGELVWSTAAPGWSKATRNSFLAPWTGGSVALLEDRRFDPEARLATIRDERVTVLCMAPTEYRLIAAHGPIGALPSLRRVITAGEALGVPALDSWREQTGLTIADGFGQTETGQLTGVRPGETAPPGSMGRPLPGVRAEIVDGELQVDPATVPTFFLGYDGSPAPSGLWPTGDRVRRDDDGWLFFESRADDVISSAGYRIGPSEVESVLQGHPAVRECGVVGLPDPERGQVVAAFVVLRNGIRASGDLARELQDHVKTETAPYKYPRRIEFVAELPKTTSGKINRAQLRAGPR